MKHFIFSLLILGLLIGCNSTKITHPQGSRTIDASIDNDTITIANDELEYEIIIIEPGFNGWLLGNARPRGFYSQSFLETRNMILVSNWNIRVLQPNSYNPNLYELQIDYNSNIDYGYEVNYKLFNYFLFAQQKYRMNLGGGFNNIRIN